MGGKIKARLRKIGKSLKAVRIWQLLLVLIPLCFLAATLLRFDHLKMVELRRAVIDADTAIGIVSAAGGAEEEIKAAEDGVAAALVELKSFTASHIVVNVVEENGRSRITFGTGPFYLEQTYLLAANRAIQEVETTIASDANPNGNIYEAVRQICQPQAIANGWAWTSQPYLECWTSELAKYPTSDGLDPNVITAAVPSTELYRRSYLSPVWTPSWAGWVCLACILLAIIIAIRFLIWAVVWIALLFVG